MFRTYFHFSAFAPGLTSDKNKAHTWPSNMARRRNQDHYECRIASSWREFEALEQDWKQLTDNTAEHDQLFASFNWNWHWCKAYLTPDNKTQNLRIITLWDNNKLVMLWPMYIKHFLGRKHLHFMGDPVSQYGDILIHKHADRQSLLQTAWRFIQDNSDVDLVILRKIKTSAAIYSLLLDLKAQRTGLEHGHAIDLAHHNSYETYQNRFKTKELKNRRRKKRRLEQHGNITTEFYAEGEQARQIALLAIRMKRDWLTQKGLLSKAFHDKTMEQFFANIASAQDKPVGILVSCLKVGNKIAAITISFGQNHYRAMHISVLDLQFEKDSPGVELLEDTIRQSMQQKDTTLDFLAPSDPYKKIWCDNTSIVEDFAIPITLIGQLYRTVMLKWIRQGGKNVFKKLPPKIRFFVFQIASRTLWNDKME